jgi:hypothetical protein
MGANVTGPTKRPPRKKKIPPGTMKTWNLASVSEDDVADITASLHFLSDLNLTLKELRKFRAQCEADGKGPFEMLARVVAHNHAVADGKRRGKRKGAETVKAQTAARDSEILEQLRGAGGKVKTVEIDRTLSKLSGSSERTIRRARNRRVDKA